MKTEQNINETVPFLCVSDMEKSLGFYVNGLGFQMNQNWIPNDKTKWCYQKKGNGSLMLQEDNKMEVGNLKGEGKVGVGVSVYFFCKDAIELYKGFTNNNLTSTEPFVSNNMWFTSVKDPDGYEINFESHTDVPEETIYSDWKQDE